MVEKTKMMQLMSATVVQQAAGDGRKFVTLEVIFNLWSSDGEVQSVRQIFGLSREQVKSLQSALLKIDATHAPNWVAE